jgi:hypothetical protein
VPGVVSSDVEIVSVEVPDPLEVRVMLDGLRPALGELSEIPDELTDADIVTVPEKPLELVRVIVDVPDDPALRVIVVGFAAMLKSGAGGGGGDA